MKQQDFESKYQATWDKLSALCNAPRALKKATDQDIQSFPALYRQVSHHLAIAKERKYSTHLVHTLNTLVMSAHHLFYQNNRQVNLYACAQLLFAFPRTLRQNSIYVALAALLFLVPLIGMGMTCYLNESMIYSLMPPEQVREVEAMYDPALKNLGRIRESDSDVQMFGFYIYNNISIAFKAFATGLFFCLGTVVTLLFNGLHIGAIMGHLTKIGFAETFYPFVIGHGAFELTAIVFSGAAGLRLGFSLIQPKHLTRLEALTLAARDAIQIMYGAGIMLLIAAFLEAFWSSSSTLPITVKLGVGTCLWLLVLWYCFFTGKARS